MKTEEKANQTFKYGVTRTVTKEMTPEAAQSVERFKRILKALMNEISYASEHNMPARYLCPLICMLDMGETGLRDLLEMKDTGLDLLDKERIKADLDLWHRVKGCTCCKTQENIEVNAKAKSQRYRRVYKRSCPIHGQFKGSRKLEEQPYKTIMKYFSKNKEGKETNEDLGI